MSYFDEFDQRDDWQAEQQRDHDLEQSEWEHELEVDRLRRNDPAKPPPPSVLCSLLWVLVCWAFVWWLTAYTLINLL